jgi:diguanylate cyclase (GGDEF)-like protein
MDEQNSQTEGKILVIDDDPIIMETIEILFDSEITVLGADNGRDGIAIAAAELPDLILLDVKMPDMDGYETYKQLRLNSEISQIPVLFLTVKNESTDEATGLELGAIDYISKPIVPQIIKARVKNHLSQKRQRDKLENLSSIDALTGIPNRRRLDEYLETEWRRAIRNKYSLSILMIDIDHFKNFNDTYGHQVGDDCLRNVAAAISQAPRRPSDLVARYGGEEFCIVLPDTDNTSALDIAERARANVEDLAVDHTGLPDQSVVTISVGVATSKPVSGDLGFDEILNIADKNLYHAKRSGRNQVSHTSE